MSEQFTIHGTARDDGYVFFTSPDIPGFRLLIEARDDVEAYRKDLISALQAFYPVYKSAEARRRVDSIIMATRPSARQTNPKSLDFLASFATGAA